MKYIRTKDGITTKEKFWFNNGGIGELIGTKEADTIEELSDGLLVEDKYNSSNWFIMEIDEFKNEQTHLKEWHYYTFIKTNKGLIYVAKMNNEGELELL